MRYLRRLRRGPECAANPLDVSQLACLVPCSETTNCGDASTCVGFADTTAYCLPASAGRDQSVCAIYGLKPRYMCCNNGWRQDAYRGRMRCFK